MPSVAVTFRVSLVALAALLATACVPEPTPPIERPDEIEPLVSGSVDEAPRRSTPARVDLNKKPLIGAIALGILAQAGDAILSSQLEGAATVHSAAVPSLTLAAVGNTRGELNLCDCKIPRGGLARRSTLFAELAANEPGVILVDLGDALSEMVAAPPKQNNKEVQDRAATMMAAIGQMGTDVMLVNLRDLRPGPDVLESLAKKHQVPLISANLVKNDSRELLFPRVHVVDADGVRVGFIGLTPSHRTDPRFLRLQNLDLIDNHEAVRAAFVELGDQELDGIILLSGLGLTETQRLMNSWNEDIPKPSLVLAGGSARLTKEPRWANDVAILEPGDKGRQVLVLRGWYRNNVLDLGQSAQQKERRALHGLARNLGDIARVAAPRPGKPTRYVDLSPLVAGVRQKKAALDASPDALVPGLELEVVDLAAELVPDPKVQAMVDKVEPPVETEEP